MRTESFELEGVTYYAEKRTCGRPGCKCADGELHGPYWYKRESDGQVRYVGKAVPANVIAARAALTTFRGDIEYRRKALDVEASHLKSLVTALTRLLNSWPLDEEQRKIIRVMGFASCLVSPDPDRSTQDGQNLVSTAVDRDPQDQDVEESCES